MWYLEVFLHLEKRARKKLQVTGELRLSFSIEHNEGREKVGEEERQTDRRRKRGESGEGAIIECNGLHSKLNEKVVVGQVSCTTMTQMKGLSPYFLPPPTLTLSPSPSLFLSSYLAAVSFESTTVTHSCFKAVSPTRPFFSVMISSNLNFIHKVFSISMRSLTQVTNSAEQSGPYYKSTCV